MVLTGAVGRLTLQGHNLVFLLVRLHSQVGQVLLHLSGHLSVFIQLLGVEKRAATYSLLMGAALHIQHVGVGATLTQRPNEGGVSGRRRRGGREMKENIEERQEVGQSKQRGRGLNLKMWEKRIKC